MKYSFYEEEMLVTFSAMDDECPQCPDDDGFKPDIHFDKETVELLLTDKYNTGG